MKITVLGAILVIGGMLLLLVLVGRAVDNEKAKTNKPDKTDSANEQSNSSE